MTKVNVFNYVQIKHRFDGDKEQVYYTVTREFRYYSVRYRKLIICQVGMDSDGATSAIDINSMGWLVHDKLCDTGTFADGSKCNNWQASMILSDILAEEGRWFRSKTWLFSTWLFGGGKARDNGLM